MPVQKKRCHPEREGVRSRISPGRDVRIGGGWTVAAEPNATEPGGNAAARFCTPTAQPANPDACHDAWSSMCGVPRCQDCYAVILRKSLKRGPLVRLHRVRTLCIMTATAIDPGVSKIVTLGELREERHRTYSSKGSSASSTRRRTRPVPSLGSANSPDVVKGRRGLSGIEANPNLGRVPGASWLPVRSGFWRVQDLRGFARV